MYAWDADGNALLGDWPGTPMARIDDNEFGEPVYQGAVPSGAVGVVFNQGMDGDQTVDVTDLTVEGYYTDGTREFSLQTTTVGVQYTATCGMIPPTTVGRE